MLFSGSLTTWQMTSCPGLSSSEMRWPFDALAPAAGNLDARHDDVVDVQEAVLVQADVHERGLEAGQDVVDLALVDVSDERAVAEALDVELPDASVTRLG